MKGFFATLILSIILSLAFAAFNFKVDVRTKLRTYSGDCNDNDLNQIFLCQSKQKFEGCKDKPNEDQCKSMQDILSCIVEKARTLTFTDKCRVKILEIMFGVYNLEGLGKGCPFDSFGIECNNIKADLVPDMNFALNAYWAYKGECVKNKRSEMCTKLFLPFAAANGCSPKTSQTRESDCNPNEKKNFSAELNSFLEFEDDVCDKNDAKIFKDCLADQKLQTCDLKKGPQSSNCESMQKILNCIVENSRLRRFTETCRKKVGYFMILIYNIPKVMPCKLESYGTCGGNKFLSPDMNFRNNYYWVRPGTQCISSQLKEVCSKLYVETISATGTADKCNGTNPAPATRKVACSKSVPSLKGEIFLYVSLFMLFFIVYNN